MAIVQKLMNCLMVFSGADLKFFDRNLNQASEFEDQSIWILLNDPTASKQHGF